MWSSAILGFFTALPKLITLAEQLITSVNQMVEAQQRQAAAQEMANAIKHAEITKDTSKLESIFKPSSKPVVTK